MAMVPPLLWKLGQRIAARNSDRFEYVSADWATMVPDAVQAAFWSTRIAQERSAFESLKARANAGEPLTSSLNQDEDLKYSAFGYALALAAREKQTVRVLDYGGNLGDYYLLGQSLVPGVHLDYHCRELAAIAEVGREINPDVSWHTDDSCLAGTYDLVMFSSSMQYFDTTVLRAAMQATAGCCLLSDVPAVQHVDSYFSTQRSGDMVTVQRHPNRADTVRMAENAGLRLVREFEMGEHPVVRKAPEQPRCLGWLFQRASAP